MNYKNRPSYDYTREAAEDFVKLAITVSGSIPHRKVDVKPFWASILFAKLCVTAVSLIRLLPENSLFPSDFNNWDAASIATLSRNLIENYHTFFYLCIEKIPDEEWEFRIGLFELHDSITRKKIFTELRIGTDDVSKFEQQTAELRDLLRQNTFFLNLPEAEQKKFIRGDHAFYLSKEAIEQRFSPGESHFKGMYRLLSVQTHTLPMSFFRTIEQRRGAGVETETELHYTSMAVGYIIPYLQLATRQLIELYPFVREQLTARQRALLDQPFIAYGDD